MKLHAEQERKLALYRDLLRDYGSRLGLLSPSDLARIRPRHIEDCLRAADLLLPSDRLGCDLGSGAGLPGLVLAIAAPDCRFVLTESQQRRVGFLEVAVERLGVPNVEIHAGRAEDLTISADLVTARAFAPLPRAWAVAGPLLRLGGRLIFFAGMAQDPELPGEIRHPEPPQEVDVVGGLANQGPLVIMTRGVIPHVPPPPLRTETGPEAPST